MIWSRELLVELVVAHPERLVELVLHLQERNGCLQGQLEKVQQQLQEKNQQLSQLEEKLEQAHRAVGG